MMAHPKRVVRVVLSQTWTPGQIHAKMFHAFLAAKSLLCRGVAQVSSRNALNRVLTQAS